MGRKSHKIRAVPKPAEPLKLDFGCGPRKREGFLGVDRIEFVGVDLICDLSRIGRWLFKASPAVPHLVQSNEHEWPAIIGDHPCELPDNSVAEAHASHFLEHLNALQRVSFVNELYRVLQPGGQCQIVVPHWASNRAYGDPTHQWPPVAEMWFYYLSQEWRNTQAPHTDGKHWAPGFRCNFDASWGYQMHQQIAIRNQEYQQHALQCFKEAAQDLVATLTAVK